jgi:NitT/TauT family transport system ATP-binding protein
METMTVAATQTQPLVAVDQVRKLYPKGTGEDVLVLDNVNLVLGNREIVSLLGRSGCGKTTLLRIVAGLMPASGGEVRIGGRPVAGHPSPDVAMVFQSFALFPWLTVQENVEVGLEAKGVSPAERHKRALQAIDLIGLDGYESAFPKELSGGMRQRVGLARALVVHPKVLLMDEPFSALDVLTAETLRTDLLDLWIEGRMPISSIVMVTHNIEEAVLMSDRILVFSSNPGRVVAEIKVDLPQPRNRLDPAFRQQVDSIYATMTARPSGRTGHGLFPGTGISIQLPRVSPNLLAGLMETVAGDPYRGHADLPAVAAPLQMEIDDLFPVAESLQLLRFADVAEGDMRLTDAGRRFVQLDPDGRKRLFAQHVLAYVPLAAHIRRVLDERGSHAAPASRFKDELEDHMTDEQADLTLRSVISWARYGEVFAYDEDAGVFSLDNPS